MTKKNMSNENQNNQNENQNEGIEEMSEFDKWLNKTPDFIRLPKEDNEAIKVLHPKDWKDKRELVTRDFEDKKTGQKTPTVRAKYMVRIPDVLDQKEKSLEAPKTLARQMEDNLAEGKYLHKIVKHSVSGQTRYTVIALD
jgi:hypothetical protein